MKYDIIAHECWHDGHGWSVNDSWVTEREVWIEAETYDGIFESLKRLGLIKKGIHRKSVDIDGEFGYDIYITDIRRAAGYYKPELTLRSYRND